ncbi:hypothetical protein QBC38DRAFT_472853 [Podospora fimiseda]|uniref:NAD(P)-binding protein n=1 Tax=Podospora fimiseda TaxID=252190 RepID=A0AAN7BT90_9PEZI|nr:hypothetical protein QBC38DRAFT_472853 [Podospora fimiseda]
MCLLCNLKKPERAKHPQSNMSSATPVQFKPRFRTDVYPFIAPAKFRGSLQDKVTIITGAAGAIGQSLAESFAVAGAKLVLTYNRTPPPPELKERCRKLGAASVDFIKCNVADEEGCESLVSQTISLHSRVDILVNNAGANALGSLHTLATSSFLQSLAVNLTGPYFLMRLLIQHFRAQSPPSGCILNISSRAGTVTIPYSTPYSTSKAALISLTSCAQKEIDIDGLGDKIHMYSLHPGGIKSTMTKEKYSEESVSNLPEQVRKAYLDGFEEIYNDSPYLNGMICVALATGIGKDVLRGKYYDVNQDLEDVLAQGEALKQNLDLHMLHTSFLGGLRNGAVPEGGYKKDEEFEFPGF